MRYSEAVGSYHSRPGRATTHPARLRCTPPPHLLGWTELDPATFAPSPVIPHVAMLSDDIDAYGIGQLVQRLRLVDEGQVQDCLMELGDRHAPAEDMLRAMERK